MQRSLFVLAPVLALTFAPAVRAQADRYELGQRLRAFERVLEKNQGSATRKRAMPALKGATTAFFNFLMPNRLAEAGRRLDEARVALVSDKKADAATLWADALATQPGTRLLDKSAGELPLTLDAFYKPAAKVPDKARVRWSMVGEVEPGTRLLDALARHKPLTAEVSALPHLGKLPCKGLAEGDHRLTTEVLVGEKVLVRREQTISVVGKLGKRLARLRKGRMR